MMISTRGRYALRVLIDLAEQGQSGFVPMKDIAARQEISLKYIERIIPVLTKNGIIEGVHGKGGGYRLLKEADDITVGSILRLTEGNLAPVACLEEGAVPCKRAAECKTLSMWKEFYDMTNNFFNKITLRDFMNDDGGDNYVI